MGLPVSPERTTVLWPRAGPRRTIVDVLGTRRQGWLEGLGQQLGGQPDQGATDQVERLDPSALAARIGMTEKRERPAAPAPSARSEGAAPWRKALRGR